METYADDLPMQLAAMLCLIPLTLDNSMMQVGMAGARGSTCMRGRPLASTRHQGTRHQASGHAFTAQCAGCSPLGA
eukprot:359188-Chlamydomonas_euryale.AAC.22